MRQRNLAGLSLLALAAVVGLSALVGWRVHSNHGFNWDLAAVVMTGVGTTLLAIVTGALAFSTWQDVRASQTTAAAAVEANQHAREEETRRPNVSLHGELVPLHTRIETGEMIWVRLLVVNATGLRAAVGTRVLVSHYRRASDPALHKVTTIGSPSLGWPSAADAVDRAVTIFGGAQRPVDFGVLRRVSREDMVPGTAYVVDLYNLPDPGSQPATPWHLHLEIGLLIVDHREVIPPIDGGWIVRVVVGATEAVARTYDVSIDWNGAAADAVAALASIEVSVTEVFEP